MIGPAVKHNLTLIVAAVFMVVVIAGAVVVREHDLSALESLAINNCEQIEALKKSVRPEPFDLARTRKVLMDLNIDPDSEQGQRLLRQARRSNARERRELAPMDC